MTDRKLDIDLSRGEYNIGGRWVQRARPGNGMRESRWVMETRRAFLVSALISGAALSSAPFSMGRQEPPETKTPDPRPVHDPEASDSKLTAEMEKKILENNDKDMKKKVERLYELASELKEQVSKTDSSKVLSLDLMKKAEEIERLARDIKNRSKG
jgi:peptidoglycan hydrolase CwlO-like protein